MAKQKEFEAGKPVPGFKPGQAPYIVSVDKSLGFGGMKAHITIEKMALKGKVRVVDTFHVTFVGTKPQAGVKWKWSSSAYKCLGWFQTASLAAKVAGGKESQLKTAVNTFVNGYELVFADVAGSIDAPGDVKDMT